MNTSIHTLSPSTYGFYVNVVVVVSSVLRPSPKTKRLLLIRDAERRGERGMHAGCVSEAGTDPLLEPASGSLESVHNLLHAITDWTSILTLIRRSGM